MLRLSACVELNPVVQNSAREQGCWILNREGPPHSSRWFHHVNNFVLRTCFWCHFNTLGSLSSSSLFFSGWSTFPVSHHWTVSPDLWIHYQFCHNIEPQTLDFRLFAMLQENCHRLKFDHRGALWWFTWSSRVNSESYWGASTQSHKNLYLWHMLTTAATLIFLIQTFSV